MRFFMFLSALLALNLGGQAAAQDAIVEPMLYSVRGVAENDTLNIREIPAANSEKIGEFGPHQTGIEVVAVSDDGGWGLVNIQDQSGWVSMRFLTPLPGQPAKDLPKGLACSGTEPFWSIDFRPISAVIADWSIMGLSDKPTLYSEHWSESPVNRDNDSFGFSLSGQDVNADGFIRTGICDDGMSDRTYGFAVDVILHLGQGRRLVSGCCSLSQD